jgi:hypothetical protein
MSNAIRTFCVLGVWLAGSASSSAQPTIDLAAHAANPVWRGTQAGARAGAILDHGAVGASDSRRDLIIGSPGGAGVTGAVYVLLGGPSWSGDLSLANASTVITGGAAGDLFGSAVAAGNVLSREGSNPKTLVVGAPGALSNRGAVYVFAAGFTGGDQYTASNAVLRILGRAGERLGTSLATADLNNDGYREIIIGGPGQNSLHVIAGGPSLSGTHDLAVTPAALTITYPGLGLTLAAGDITGDGIYELLVGHPSVNAVHVMFGRNGTMPTKLDISYGGIDAGDGVGNTIRIADVDSDRISDVIIGAPDADGPGNSRADAGEAYLIWGRPGLNGGSLALADVTFYSNLPGSRMGAFIAGGDINRDTPNDLVFGSPGARSGAGRLEIYYGRERSGIGVLRADGTRAVDFASENPDRVILGDTAGGTITAAQVYEVTGEGARDVIVGMSGNGGGVGAVYFTISPRLTLASPTVTLNGHQGLISSAQVATRNISVIPITWRTSTDRAWLHATPEGATSLMDPGSLTVAADGAGLAPGTYSGNITVASTSSHLMMSQTIAVTFVVRATQPAPATPPAAGFPPGAGWKLFWRHATENWLAVWEMNGVTLTRSASLSINQMSNTSWKIAGVGDLNGDGYRDIVWQADDGSLAAWLLQDNQVIATGYLSVNKMPDPTWKIRGVGDTNGDGRADLVWQNTGDGRLGVWFMNGMQVVSPASLSIPRMPTSGWHVRAVGDADGDRRADILWHKSDTGELALWTLNGATVTSTARLSIASMTNTAWQMVGAEDVNGDGKADILWQNNDGSVAAWYLDGKNVLFTTKLNPSNTTSTDWKVVGPR